ncbi:hypothetical protein [Cryobacterium sp. Y62]|uniref:hypothetical protein n=1 Tax=Cryobacterium sp. Y62 TaxID=2048284 RepID=UPI000CE44ABA|nr:hypothetical protein [Cryobacterium sp. Y62]
MNPLIQGTAKALPETLVRDQYICAVQRGFKFQIGNPERAVSTIMPVGLTRAVMIELLNARRYALGM